MVIILSVMSCDHLFSMVTLFFFFFKQKTAYEMRISDWSSDVCSSDLARPFGQFERVVEGHGLLAGLHQATGQRPAGRGGHQSLHGGGRPYARGVEIGRASCRERVCQYV